MEANGSQRERLVAVLAGMSYLVAVRMTSPEENIVTVLTAFVQTIVLLSASMAANLQSRTAALPNSAIAVGDVAPDFTLEDQNKNKITLSDTQKSPVVLVFYRGYW